MKEPILFRTDQYKDNRGWFMESYNRNRLRDEFGIHEDWMQDNHSSSEKDVIRGIHYQLDLQAKLVRCSLGRIIDVVVDLRAGPDFGKCSMYELSLANCETLYIPGGFGHSFLALEQSHVIYKVDRPWCNSLDRGIRWDDPRLSIPWGDLADLTIFEEDNFILSERDKSLPFLVDADLNFKETD